MGTTEPVPEHGVESVEMSCRIGEALQWCRGEVVGCGYHQTSSVHPLCAQALDAYAFTPRASENWERRVMVSANGNTPIIFLSDAAEPRCIRKELQ